MNAAQRVAATLALLGSSAALAEPYSGSATEEPIVRVLAWAILLLGCLFFAFLVGMVASQGRWRTRRFAVAMGASFLVALGLALLVHVPAALTELVSLVLHILLM